MVRANATMNIDIPSLTPTGRRRLVRRIQQVSLARARKEIATPSRRRFPRETGELRRTFKASRPKRTGNNRIFTALLFRFQYYAYFQHGAWTRFQIRAHSQGAEIVRDALAQALKEGGFK